MRTPLLLGTGLLLVLACHAHAEDKEPDVVARLKKAKVGGPFNQRHAAVYGHLNHDGTLLAIAANNEVDVYAYHPSRITFQYSSTPGGSGVAFSPGS